MAFSLKLPAKIIFGRGKRTEAVDEICRLGKRIVLVRGRSVAWADTLQDDLRKKGAMVETVVSMGEPSFPDLVAALDNIRTLAPDCVVAVGGGSAIDLGKALAALAQGAADPLVHFEIVGDGRSLDRAPLPFVAIPTTAGTGAEATKNAVISFPEHRRKVSLRDDRMLADLALIDPALTDDCPHTVTLSSGLDALTQVIEPFVSSRANILTDALCREAIPRAIGALAQLMEEEKPAARDDMARASFFGGIALANAGLGAVHGIAGVVGGRSNAGHGALCGRLLPGVLLANQAAASGNTALIERLGAVADWLGAALGVARADAFSALEKRIDDWGLSHLSAMGFDPNDCDETARLAQSSSSMAGNPVTLSHEALIRILRHAL